MKEALDRIFSAYIRHRDCPNGTGRCISCGCSITPETCDAGHYIPRSHMSTRYSEANVHAQCRQCNRYRDGNEPQYRNSLIHKFGPKIIDELQKLRNTPAKLGPSDYKRLISIYKHKLLRLQ